MFTGFGTHALLALSDLIQILSCFFESGTKFHCHFDYMHYNPQK